MHIIFILMAQEFVQVNNYCTTFSLYVSICNCRTRLQLQNTSAIRCLVNVHTSNDFLCTFSYGMLDREEKVRIKPARIDRVEEERSEQMKAAVKPKEVAESVDFKLLQLSHRNLIVC